MRKLPALLNAAALCVLITAVVGCGKNEAPEATADDIAVDAPMLEQPTMTTDIQSNMPDKGELVTELMIVDNEIGTGPIAERGKVVKVHYHGWVYDVDSSDHKGVLFDRSKIRGPFSFRLGGGRVIRGWDHGLLGMRQGGKRTLYVPADMGYAERGVPGLIPPGATLMFEVELLEVKS